ncbi:hypothetical protein FOZ63_012245, partial [Perkinsus olseni]
MEMYRPGVLEVFSGRVVSGDIDLPVSAMSELISTLEMVVASEQCQSSGEESKAIVARSNTSIITMCARAMAEQNDLSLPLVQRMRALTDDFSSMIAPLLSLLLEEAQSYSALLGAWTSDAIAAAAAASTESGADQLSSTLADSITICGLLADGDLNVMDDAVLQGLQSALTEAYYQNATAFEAEMVASFGSCLASTLSRYGPQDASRFLDTLSEDACAATRIEQLLPDTCLS